MTFLTGVVVKIEPRWKKYQAVEVSLRHENYIGIKSPFLCTVVDESQAMIIVLTNYGIVEIVKWSIIITPMTCHPDVWSASQEF